MNLKLAIKALLLIATFFTLTSVINYKFERIQGHELSSNYITMDERDRQLACLAKNIYYEAGHEPFEGKVAVAQVTMNRTESGRYPNDVCKVVHQKTVVYNKVICQFSWYCDQGPKLRPMDPTAYHESMEVAKKVLLENFRLPSLRGAMYYHADYIDPRWGKPKLIKIGRHIFYGEN